MTIKFQSWIVMMMTMMVLNLLLKFKFCLDRYTMIKDFHNTAGAPCSTQLLPAKGDL